MALRDKLLFAARAATANDLPSMKTAVRQATRISGPLDWREAGAYGDGLMSLAAILRQRLDGPHTSQVVELTELAIAGAQTSLEQIDDSGGDVMPAIMELASVHLEACRQTRPDAVKLAERLFLYQTEGAPLRLWRNFADFPKVLARTCKYMNIDAYSNGRSHKRYRGARSRSGWIWRSGTRTDGCTCFRQRRHEEGLLTAVLLQKRPV